MFSRDLTLAKFDADLFAAMEQEAQRQEEHIELIASENYTSPAVMEAQGSVLTNKYAEDPPAHDTFHFTFETTRAYRRDFMKFMFGEYRQRGGKPLIHKGKKP